MTKRVKLLGSLIIAFLLCLCIGIVPLFNSAPNKASAAAINPLRYGSGTLNTYYFDHWRNGQGQRVSGETSGRWYFGYGDVSDSAYSFTQATYASKGDTDNNSQYTTGFAHQSHYQYDVSTRAYSSASTQTMFVFEAEANGFVSFSGLAMKNSETDMQTFLGTQNGLTDVWLPDLNTANADHDWMSGGSFTISMWLVNASGTSGKLIMSKTFTSGFAYLFPNDQVRVAQGEKVVFGYKCNTVPTGKDEWTGTHALWGLSSEFTANDFAGYENYTFVGQSTGLITPYINHWSGQGNYADGETNGTWRFGTGTASSSSYTFSQAAQNTTVAADTKKWGTGNNMMSWGFSVGTSTSTASIYEMTATSSGSFTFSGIISKATFNKENLAGVQNQCYSIWLNGINYTSGDFDWYNGDSYKVGMYKIATNGTVTALYEKTFTTQYAWLVPQEPINLLAGEKVAFSLQAVEFGTIGSADKSSTMMLLTSQATSKITASVTNDTAQGTVTGLASGDQFDVGDSVGITITPNAGYKIASVLWNGVAETVTATGMTLNKTIDANGANLIVSYSALPTYTFNITNDDTKGTITTDLISGSSYEEGKAIEVSISANSGYVISSVQYNGVEKLSGSVATYSLSETLTQNSTLVVTYTASNITATVNFDSTMGTVTGVSDGASLTLGESLTITITPKAAYKLVSITYNGVAETVIPTGTTLNKTVTDAGVVLNVVFEVIKYQVTVDNDSTKGTVEGITDGPYEVNTSLEVTITAKAGYKIESVLWGGISAGCTVDVATTTFTIEVKNNATLEVNYVEDTTGGSGSGSGDSGSGGDDTVYYEAKVTINDKKMGTVKGVTNGLEVAEGEEKTLKVTAKEGYEIKSITIDGKEQKIKDATKFEKDITFDADVEIEIEFVAVGATEMVKGWACLSSLNGAAPMGITLLAGAVAMLFIKKKRNND
ncbi:MAG: hypothetical protein IJY57_05150 [Clostridia bacterium]|nr:hypothetical protein [Clostridia bacterium]